MRINNNLMAINTHRQLGVSAGESSKSMEKLSSGLKINRAGDDAAGLAISEKMRGQIRGLSMASKNSADTISLIQTAEGALNETHSILQRMRELTVQAANDTNTDADRTEIQSEIKQLIKEVDRIGNTTEFNTKKLLDGSQRGVSDAVKATAQMNANSAVGVNLDELNGFKERINNDSNFFMDGAHMLVRVNGSPDSKPDINNDFKFVGPDGAEYKFVSGSEQGIGVRALQDNTILTSVQMTTKVELTNLQAELLSAVNGALQGLNEGNFEIANDSNSDANTKAGAAGESMMMTAARNAANTIKAKYGNDETISAAIDILIEANDTAIKKAFSYTSGTGTGINAVAGSWGTFTSVTNLTNTSYTGGAINSTKINDALNALGANVTIAAGSDIKNESVLAKGTILSVGSKFTVDDKTTITLNVDRGDVAVRMDANKIVWVGDTSLATGSSITLKDGLTLKNNGSGSLEITQGSATLASKATVKAAGTAGINFAAGNSVIAAGSTLTDANAAVGSAGSSLAIGSVIGAAKNAEVVRGSIELGAGAVSMTFGGTHTLKAEFNDMEVGLSNTMVFTKARAGSNDLENSVMGQVGANSGQILFISMNDMRASALGVDNIDVTSRYGAAMGVETVNNALQKVSQQRSILGAAQNRLEHTIKNLDTAAENLQAAESRIRDVDMAKEIMTNTKNNILQQASQAMLAQANQAPQSVLQLLR